MEFNADFIQENGLTDKQIEALNSVIDSHIAEVKNEFSGQANSNAEKIIEGAGKKTVEMTGIQRDNGEKWASYLERASGLYFEGTKNSLKRKEQELDDKIKNSKGDETLKAELQSVKEQLTGLKQKEAEYEDWLKNDYKGKAQTYSEKLTKMEQRVAFRDNLPNRPETVNKYEWEAKVKEFQSELLEKNNLVFDENETAWIVDKENEFKKIKLEDAVKQNKEIQELIKGREQKGLGSSGKKQVEVEGVPFKVPEEATPSERQKAIKEYLASQNIDSFNPEYAKKYAELNAKILGLGKKQA